MNYLLSYGSLMNRYSREVYSGLVGDVIPAVLKGWSRGWCTQYPDEAASYAGAYASAGSLLNTVLVATEIDDGIRQREREYRFTELDRNQFDLRSEQEGDFAAGAARYWICETANPGIADQDTPLPQSYVDTCLLGCLESGGEADALEFVEQTSGWEGVWVNDRQFSRPIYPRGAPVSDSSYQQIDEILEAGGVLQYRQQNVAGQ
jgi:hypothetical protein